MTDYTYEISIHTNHPGALAKSFREISDQLMRLTPGAKDDFEPPSEDEINLLVAGARGSIFRNSRDLAAHARELQAVYAYVHAIDIYPDEPPMRFVQQQLGCSITKCRATIERARSHGYLTRNDGGAGGEVTLLAMSVAAAIKETASQVGAR